MKKNDFVMITTRSVVRENEVTAAINDILQFLGGDGVICYDFGCCERKLTTKEWKEFLSQYREKN